MRLKDYSKIEEQLNFIDLEINLLETFLNVFKSVEKNIRNVFLDSLICS